MIDDALLRPSRFKPVRIDLPGLQARKEIAAKHAERYKVPVDDRLLDQIARSTEQMNGDEISSIFRDARAGEIIGQLREKPRPADAFRLGELVGLLRRTMRERDLDREQPTGPRRGAAAGRGQMFPMTGDGTERGAQ
jgi:transitional endoplasmic reticulum ATPase